MHHTSKKLLSDITYSFAVQMLLWLFPLMLGAFNLKPLLKGINSENQFRFFPYRLVLDSADFKNPAVIIGIKETLDSAGLSGDTLLFNTLTDHWKDVHYRDSALFLRLTIDRIKVGEEYITAARMSKSNALLLNTIGGFYLTEAGNDLLYAIAKDPSIIYQSDFQCLAKRLEEDRFAIPLPPKSAMEKVAYNLSERRWGYLLTRFYANVTWPIRFLIFFVIGLLILQQLYFIKLLCKKYFK